jgi:hypothetical protein
MRGRAVADLRDTVYRLMIDDEISFDCEVGTCRDGPSDLCLSQAPAGAELCKAPRWDCKAPPPQQRDGLPYAI